LLVFFIELRLGRGRGSRKLLMDRGLFNNFLWRLRVSIEVEAFN
jgi:hypothetical protein